MIEPEDNSYLVPFTNEETERMQVGEYEWDIRIALDAVTDDEGRVTGGREIITPWGPAPMRIVKAGGML